MKKLIAMLLSVATTVGLCGAFSASASSQPIGTPVSTVSDFVNMKADGVYYLTNDIDFSEKTYTGNVYTREFKGVLDGNGYAILGITIKAQNGDTGIFGNGFSGTMKNLTIGSESAPVNVSSTGSSFSVGVVAGTMKSGTVIDNCEIYANVKGDGKTSGITSYIFTGNITVTNTKMYGTVTGNPASGFFALSNDGSSDIKIQNCINYADVTAKNSSAGGLYTIHAGAQGRSGSLEITGCANYGTIIATDWRVGGIVGEYHEHKGSTMKVDYCYNMGTITMNGGGGFAAGIVGGASFDAPTGQRTITNVYNGGLIQNTVSPNNAYQIAFSNSATTAVTVKNASFISGTATKNVVEDSVTAAGTLKTLVSTVTAYPVSPENNRFVKPAGNDNNGYPILAHEVSEHTNVKTYACGRRVCLDCEKLLSTEAEEKHTFKTQQVAASGYLDAYENATCSACGHTEKRATTASTYRPAIKNGVYEISSADHLKWLSANLAAGLMSGTESVVLTADIDLKNEAFTPIGTAEYPFGGNFDGGMHTISNLKVATTGVGGLFGVIADAVNISMLRLDNVSVEATKEAGALFGKVGANSFGKVEWVLITNATVVSKDSSAGGLAGSTHTAALMKFQQCVVDTATVTGNTSASAMLGLGNSSEVKNCFVNARAEASDQKATGALAYTTGSYSQQNSGYVRQETYGQKDGERVDAKDFATGAIANKVNSYANSKVYGTDGKTVIMGNPIYAVYYGEEIAYTSTLLADTGDVEVYTDGKTVAIVVKRESGPKLTDLSIKLTVGGKAVEVKLSQLTLTRRVKLSGAVCTIESGSALYTIAMEGVTAYEIGSYSGAVVGK